MFDSPVITVIVIDVLVFLIVFSLDQLGIYGFIRNLVDTARGRRPTHNEGFWTRSKLDLVDKVVLAVIVVSLALPTVLAFAFASL